MIHELYAAIAIGHEHRVMAMIDSAAQVQKCLRRLLRRGVQSSSRLNIRWLHRGSRLFTSDSTHQSFSAPTQLVPLVTATECQFESGQYWEAVSTPEQSWAQLQGYFQSIWVTFGQFHHSSALTL